ncbi:hypothetical protein AB0O01_32045 [Streptomyces sp. NPDC093252]|uniref:hypothetical protein n=1 Tax=Streptomyces sp. NPDC093252 TaxID=3154980 RepID=UPI0034188023
MTAASAGEDGRPQAGRGEPDSFTLAVPDTWTLYDLHGDGLARARVRVLREARDQGERDRINRLFRGARRIMVSARQRGALYAAGTTTLYEDGLLMAGVMVFRVTPPPGHDFSARELAARYSAAGERERGTRTGERGRGPRTGERERGAHRRFTVHELPHAGPAGRLTGLETADPTGDLSYRLLAVNTVVPVPRSRSSVVISCYSPNLPLAGELYRVFDAITSTFRFTYVREGPVS